MQPIARRTLALAVAIVCCVPLLAASRAEQIDRLLRKYSELRQFNGAALVADASGVVHKAGYGYANFEWQIPNTPDTRFRLGSITKQFTSMLIMQLVAEGKIKLDDRITTHLPDYRKDTGDRITITQLLNHTSGIPSYTSSPNFFKDHSRNRYEVAEFIKQFASGDLEYEPGSKYRYNNSAYFVLGAIIEKITGKPYAQAVQERILDPLGMKATGYDLATPIIPKRASGYQYVGGTYTNAPYLDMSVPYAAGSLYSTVEDLYAWDRALYTDKLLRDDLKKTMWTPALDNYAFGWVVRRQKLDDGKTEVPVVMHGGGIHGFNTLLVRVPDRKELVVLLDNTSRGDKLDAIAEDLLSVLHGMEPRLPRKPVSEELAPLVKSGSGAAIATKYRELRTTRSEQLDFNERELNTVGYDLLRRGRVDDAIEVFKLNVEMYPQGGNPYDSLGEAYATKGEKKLALENYRRAHELDPKNQNAKRMIERLERPVTESSVPLESYVGRFQLAPSFVLSFFIEDGKLVTQATGQQKLGVTQSGPHEFSVVGVPARVVFEVAPGGKATAVTLFQNGREMKAPRVE